MISILLPDLRGGGVERIRLVLAREFARAGYEVEFVLMQARGELLEEARSTFSVVDLRIARIRSLPWALIRYLRWRRPVALLAGMWPLTGIAGWTARYAGLSTRVVASEHVDFRSTTSFKAYERYLLNRFGRTLYAPCVKVVGVSTGVCESLKEVAGLPESRLSVIHNPVRQMTPGEITKDDRRLLSSWLDAEKKLIAIGSLKPAKGFDILLQALKEVRKHMDAHLLILGEGELRHDLERASSELDIERYVHLPGFRENTATFLREADCFVLSSHWEGFGNVVLEALSAGITVVSTACPSGPSEILVDGKFGYLTPPGDHIEMARSIIEAVKAERKPDFLKGRAADFKPENQAARYLKLLLDL